jgi:hypothetical protein
MKAVTMFNDIIKSTYNVVMKRKTSHNKIEFLRRVLKYKYNISIGIDALEKRDQEYKRNTNL